MPATKVPRYSRVARWKSEAHVVLFWLLAHARSVASLKVHSPSQWGGCRATVATVSGASRRPGAAAGLGGGRRMPLTKTQPGLTAAAGKEKPLRPYTSMCDIAM